MACATWGIASGRHCAHRIPLLPPIAPIRRVELAQIIACVIALSGCASRATHDTDARALAAGWSALDAGHVDAARGLFLAHSDPGTASRLRGEAMLGLGKCELSEANPARSAERAAQYLESALPLVSGSGWTGTCRAALAEAYLELGLRERAREHLERAYPFLDGPNQRRAAGILALLYEEEGFADPAADWKQRAGDFVADPEFASVSKRFFPHTQARPAPVAHPAVAASPISRGARSPAAAAPAPPSGKLVTRSQWGARRVRLSDVVEMGKITRITIHHTADAEPASIRSFGDAKEYLQKLQAYFQSPEKGYGDIGYHYLIDERGVTYEGRPLRYQGAHAGNKELNRGNVGIALIGNFDRTRPSQPQLASLRTLVLDLCARHKIPYSKVEPHHAVKENGGESTTNCPGRHLLAALPKLFASAKKKKSK